MSRTTLLFFPRPRDVDGYRLSASAQTKKNRVTGGRGFFRPFSRPVRCIRRDVGRPSPYVKDEALRGSISSSSLKTPSNAFSNENESL